MTTGHPILELGQSHTSSVAALGTGLFGWLLAPTILPALVGYYSRELDRLDEGLTYKGTKMRKSAWKMPGAQ